MKFNYYSFWTLTVQHKCPRKKNRKIILWQDGALYIDNNGNQTVETKNPEYLKRPLLPDRIFCCQLYLVFCVLYSGLFYCDERIGLRVVRKPGTTHICLQYSNQKRSELWNTFEMKNPETFEIMIEDLIDTTRSTTPAVKKAFAQKSQVATRTCFSYSRSGTSISPIINRFAQ